jgi:eukaryotic-like serine/threonine-protein kinase
MPERTFMARYHAVRLLGEGNMGEVYLARQAVTNRQVVVKVMRKEIASDQHYREAFRREIEFLARFKHRCAPAFYDASINDPQGPCVVMEYVDGVPLDQLLQRHGRLSAARVGRLLGDLCSVLQAAHTQGIIHRDLKPGNLMVVDAGTPRESLKVLDFGVARLSESPARGFHVQLEKLTSAEVNFLVGTPEFICPEQFRQADMDHRGDLYSVGVILYQLLTARLPFEYEKLEELTSAHLYEKPPSFATRRAFGVRPAVEAVVQACLAKDPADRPQSARELARRYEEAIGQKIWNEAEPPPPKAAAPAAQPAVKDKLNDPNAIVWKFEAWMTEQVAAIKLRGYLNDIGGEVIESMPGLIRMRVRRTRTIIPEAPKSGILSRLAAGKTSKPAEEVSFVPMDVYMEKPPSGQAGMLLITVQLRPGSLSLSALSAERRAWCDKKLMELGAYLMAKRV